MLVMVDVGWCGGCGCGGVGMIGCGVVVYWEWGGWLGCFYDNGV